MGLSVHAATGAPIKSRRLFIYDDATKARYLIDSGADVSVLPAKKSDRVTTADLKLYAANGTAIDTYGERLIELHLGFRRSFRWRFIVANVQYPIIGADFLAHFELLPNLKRRILVDGATSLRTKGTVESVHYSSITTIGTSEFSKILAEFPGLTQPTTRRACKFVHKTTHVIETTGQPVSARARRLPPEKLRAARTAFEEMLKLEDIRPSKSQWSSPIHVVPKKGPEKWRICGDYRALNSKTKPDRYPVPNILDFNARLAGSKIFSTLDIKRAYHHIPVEKNDIEKTAVITPFGLFEHVSMPFGLKNAAQSFQRFIDGITRDLDFVYVYIDDVLVASADESQHENHVRTVLQRFLEAGLVLNAAKCDYAKPEVSFLGYRVNAVGIKPEPDRVQPILNYPRPNDLAGLRRFLGMINFFRRSIPHAAEIQRRLRLLINTNKKNDKTALV